MADYTSIYILINVSKHVDVDFDNKVNDEITKLLNIPKGINNQSVIGDDLTVRFSPFEFRTHGAINKYFRLYFGIETDIYETELSPSLFFSFLDAVKYNFELAKDNKPNDFIISDYEKHKWESDIESLIDELEKLTNLDNRYKFFYVDNQFDTDGVYKNKRICSLNESFI